MVLLLFHSRRENGEVGIFLKMADEYSKPPYNCSVGIPAAYTWPSLKAKRGAELEGHYIVCFRQSCVGQKQ